MSLLTPNQLASVRKIGELGMVTTVEIYPSEFNVGLDDTFPDGSDLNYATTPSATVKGWLVATNEMTRDIGVATINSTAEYRLRLPVGTEIEPGWVVKIGGSQYLVEDSATDQSWPEWLNCTLKRNK